MKPIAFFSALALLPALNAHAQPPAEPQPQTTTSESHLEATTPSSATVAPSQSQTNAGPAPTAAPQPVTGGCELGPHAGIPEEDAQTAARLVCEELLRQKAPTDQNYRVELLKLGDAIFLSVAAIRPDAPGEQRRVRLANIEEAPDATPRLVTALLQHKDVGNLQEYGNLLQSETRAPLRKSGALLVGVGVMGQYSNHIVAPGFELSLRYDTPDWVIGSALRYSGGSTKERHSEIFSWGVGGRYMFTHSDAAPFAGAGLAFETITASQERTSGNSTETVFRGDRSGLAVYGEAGVEFLRTHKSRLAAAIRVDAPIFNVSTAYGTNTRYYLPTSFTLSYSFN
ncbi:MAG TPA: hypothetical protein VFQ61_03980 [Polyangiaceae bacterium]|nr:hypothetical protein [Polyangiaceae bacterium]